MDRSSPYYKAHLVVAAARLIDHKDGVPPNVSQLSGLTGYSIEEVQRICNDLEAREVVRKVQAGDAERIYIRDPGPMEELPRSRQGPDMEKEVEKFAAKQKARMDSIAVSAKDEKQRKKDLFAALEKQLKSQVAEKEAK